MTDPAAVLRAFADLAPGASSAPLDVARSYGPFVHLAEPDAIALLASSAPHRTHTRAPLRRLAGLDALHRDERIVRAGWGFVVGHARVDGTRRRVCLPLLSRPVRLTQRRSRIELVGVGDVEVAERVAGPQRSGAELELPAPLGLADPDEWLLAAAAAAGFEVAELRSGSHPGSPVAEEVEGRLVGVPEVALYASRDIAGADLHGSLLAWSHVGELERSAFATLYGSPPPVDDPADDPSDVRSPLPLTDAQRAVVRTARSSPVTVVSGAPGSGKSHTLAAVAIDEVARGRSVLVATASLEAAEVLADLLERHPGPTPVRFGSSERREALAANLTGGLPGGPDAGEVARLAAQVGEAEARHRSLRRTIERLLATEQLAARAAADAALVPQLARLAPGAFALDSDLERLSALHDAATAASDGWWGTRRRQRAERRLRRRAGVASDVPLEEVRAALDLAAARRAAAELAATGGTRIGDLWDALAAAEAEAASRIGELVAAESAVVPAGSRPAVAALAAALRAGRGRRREALATMDGSALLRALPLWVGTLRDVEDLLPRHPGLFDLVILDEASQSDQLRAAPALLRGRRAVVAGDPRQLQHVSFVADLDVADRIDAHGLAHLADRLDVRRTSALDLAAASAPGIWLDEHFRSVPHLIAFSAERFYPQPIRLVTRHPANETADAIDVVHVSGTRDERGVNAAEVDAVADVLRELRAGDPGTVAVISPLRAQADALEEMILAGYDVTAITELGLRTGTVHQLQGGERDVVVISLAIGPQEGARARAFVEDPNLFNVMVTRARRRIVLVTSLGPDAGGLIGDYLAHAARPGSPPAEPSPPSPWAAAVAGELRGLGCTVRPAYPVGAWTVDLCIGDGEDAAALLCGVAADGPAAHIDRQRTLQRAGWRILEALPSAHDGDAVRAALDVAAQLRAQ